MKFKVIVCSNCKWARGVKTETEKSTCTRCGGGIKVSEAVPYFETDSEMELAEAVRNVNTKLHDKESSSAIDRITLNEKEKSKIKGGLMKTYEREIFCLSEQKDVFSFEELLFAISSSIGVPVSEVDDSEVLKMVERLKEEGLLIEPRSGQYKKA